ncbi:MAG TPA: hypothetical protein ENN14_00725 [Chloroflexi bacterium]|nr:hypothetical protein [Chloroflexota bacterium]
MAEFTAARESFKRARRKALWNALLAALTGRPNQLLAWDEVKDKLHMGGQIYRGIQQVPISQIIGSVNRYRDFDRAFLPAQEFTADRWRGISRAFYREENLPPVTLYQIGETYFVLDGNHRVSVARERGQEFIDAEVIEAQTRVPIGPDLNASDLEIKGEYADFLARTHLDELHPEAAIEFTIAGGYQRLLEHIAVHRYFMGLEQQCFISEAEAVTDWYIHLYRPVVDVIEAHELSKEFADRTPADLYLWVIEHLHFLREQDAQITAEEAAEHFAGRYTANLLKRAAHLIGELWKATAGAGAVDARTEFLQQTQLHISRPGQQIQCTGEGCYQRLLEHIAVHRHFMGLEQQREVSLSIAANDWYDNLYQPIIAVVREEALLQEFPDREEGDLYLWISERFPEGGRPIPEMVDAFTRQHTTRAAQQAIAQLQAFQNAASPERPSLLAADEDDLSQLEAALPVTIPGGHQRLREQIAEHRYYLGQQQQRHISAAEAQEDWYHHIYQPVAQLIRQYAVLAEFPNRTETDLYLWLMEHRRRLPTADETPLLADLAAQQGGPPLARAADLIQQLLARITTTFEEPEPPAEVDLNDALT